MRASRSLLQAVRAAPRRPTPSVFRAWSPVLATPLASVRAYSTPTPVRDYEAQLRGVLEKAARNVEAGVRAPESEDMSLRLIMVAKPGGESASKEDG